MSHVTATQPFSIRTTLNLLIGKTDLERPQMRAVFEALMGGELTPAQVGAFLAAYQSKGVTAPELAAAAMVMRDKSVHLDISGDLLDTCGTGGAIKGTFNISTAAALVAAAGGARVVKHGNRSASGSTGSADVLEALGVGIDTNPARLPGILETASVCFAYARSHHPAMKHVAGVRSELGIVTLFNLLGPLTNPAGAKFQLLGVFASDLTMLIARVLGELGSTRAWVVHAEDGMDELSTTSPTLVSEWHQGKARPWRLDPLDYGIPRAKVTDLHVKSAKESAEVITRIANGEKGPPRDITVLNAAAALVVVGKAPDMPAGIKLASETIDSGRMKRTVENLVKATA